MYATSRVLRASMPRMMEAVGLTLDIVGRINEKHGGQLAVHTAIGNDPAAIGVMGMYEQLEEMIALRDSYMADEEIVAKMASAEGLLSAAGGVEDTIWSVLKPLPEPQGLAVVTGARVVLSRVAEAVTFALEAAEVAAGLGTEGGVLTAMTGDRARLLWVSGAASMGEVQQQTETMNASSDYLDLFKRSEGLFVESSLETHIWQQVG